MKKIAYAAAVAGTVLGANQAMAVENWTAHLPGVTEGLAAGALPPQGVYFINDTLIGALNALDKNGKKAGAKVTAFVDVPILLWNPGVKLPGGGDFAMAVAQPFDFVSLNAAGANGTALTAKMGAFETLLIPVMAAYALPANFHVAGSVGIYVPDGAGHTAGHGGPTLPNSINYWAFEPTVGVSWLSDGWNLSGNFYVDINMKNTESNFQSGDVFGVDLTATKDFGKWKAGLVGAVQKQLANDTAGGVTMANSEVTRYQAGPMVGYNFGPVVLEGWYEHAIYVANTVGGDNFWTRIVIPLH